MAMFAFTYFAELPWYTCMASRIATQVSLTLYYLLFPSHNPHPPRARSPPGSCMAGWARSSKVQERRARKPDTHLNKSLS
jgi:hypothetical protein